MTLSLGLIEIEQHSRAMLGPTYPHPFGPAGSIRILSKLAVALVARGTGVVLSCAGMQAVDRETFLARLGASEDPRCMPVAAWTEIVVDAAAKRYRSLGMSVFALPDVSVAFDPESAWSGARAFEAVSRVSSLMVRANRTLEVGSRITYAVSTDDCGVRLDRVMPAVDDASTWMAVSPRPVPMNVYRAVLEEAYRARFRGDVVHEVTGGGGDVPEHLVVTYALEGGSVVTVTNGLGRVVRGGFLIDDAGTLELAPDHRVDLLVLVPVSEAEYAAAKAEGTDVWLQRVLGEPRGRPPRIMARWKRATGSA